DHREEHGRHLPGLDMGLEPTLLADDATHLRPAIKPLDHGNAGHDPQEQGEAAGPVEAGPVEHRDRGRPDVLDGVVGMRIAHGNASSSATGAKWRSTSACVTSARLARCQRGRLSLSMITARMPS